MGLVLGITGIIGTGKSAAAKHITEKYNFQLIDVDEIGHKLLEKESILYPQIIAEFKTSNRKKIAEIVFKNQEKLQVLNKILHPMMFKIVKARLEDLKNQGVNVVIDAALLYQIGLDSFCHKIICLLSDNEVIYGRLIEKGLNKKQINERLANAPQIPEEGNILIENNKSMDELFLELDKILVSLTF